MVISVDDLLTNSLHHDIETWQDITRGILEALGEYKVPAIGFVNESKLYQEAKLAQERVDLLRQWLKSNHQLGNHGFAHLDLHKVPLGDYLANVKRGIRFWRSFGQARRALGRNTFGTPSYTAEPIRRLGRQ